MGPKAFLALGATPML